MAPDPGSASGEPPRRPSKIICVGRNYHAHARELGGEVPASPLIFLKSPSSVVGPGEPIRLPPGAGRVDFEGEIAFVVGRTARFVSVDEGWDPLSHVLAANDVTAREMQRADGQWTRAKGFDTFCPLGPAVPLEAVDLNSLSVVTRVNGRVRQEGALADAHFSPPMLVAHISRIMTLEPGDLILTGTPEGVGPLAPGDQVEVEVPGVSAVVNPVRSGDGEPWERPASPAARPTAGPVPGAGPHHG